MKSQMKLTKVAAIISSILSSQAKAAPEPHWLAYGDIRGHIEPCGCDPETDLGGIKRLAAIIQSNNPELLLSLGNNLSADKAKRAVVQGFEAKVKPIAILFNHAEQSLIADIEAEQTPKLPYILSHTPNKGSLPAWVKPWVTTDRLTVFGFANSAEPLPKLLQDWKKQLSREGDRYKILLYSGDDSTLQAILAEKLFDKIIASNTAPLDAEPSDREKSQPGRLLRLDKVYMVPSFGQGVLLGGVAKEAVELESLLGTSKSCRSALVKCADFTKIKPDLTPILWLTKEYQKPGLADELFQTYNAGAQDAFEKKAIQRADELQNTPFAGAHICLTCHKPAYDAWQASAHSHALVTLKKQGKDRDGDCVTCHVLGYDVAGGYADEKTSPQFAGVQCETCHGAAKAHSQNPFHHLPAQKEPRTVCESCHKLPHSSHFDFEVYWSRIKH